MVIHKVEWGNDLTRRTVDVFTLKELASCRIEQIIAPIRDFARIVQAFPSDPEDGDDDSPAQIANDLLGKIDCLVEAVQNRKVKPNLVAMIAFDVGVLSERLEWMWRHADATRKGIQRKNHEELAQRKGVEGNKRKRRTNIRRIAELLRKELSTKQLAILTNSALARRLAKSGLGGNRAIRGYVAEARRLHLIPARSEM